MNSTPNRPELGSEKLGFRVPAGKRGDASTSTLRRQLAGDLDEIVLMALRKEPDRRYVSQ